MEVKLGKSFPSFFFNVGDDVRAFLFDYIDYVRDHLGWDDDHSLFPRTRQGDAFGVKGLADTAWRTAGPVWALFKRAFAAAGLPYFSPHAFRRTLAQAVLRAAPDPEMIKILSQNLGHQGVLVTLTSYGAVDRQRQAERITALDLNAASSSDDDALAELLRAISNPTIAKLLKKAKDEEDE